MLRVYILYVLIYQILATICVCMYSVCCQGDFITLIVIISVNKQSLCIAVHIYMRCS